MGSSVCSSVDLSVCSNVYSGQGPSEDPIVCPIIDSRVFKCGFGVVQVGV